MLCQSPPLLREAPSLTPPCAGSALTAWSLGVSGPLISLRYLHTTSPHPPFFFFKSSSVLQGSFSEAVIGKTTSQPGLLSPLWLCWPSTGKTRAGLDHGAGKEPAPGRIPSTRDSAPRPQWHSSVPTCPPSQAVHPLCVSTSPLLLPTGFGVGVGVGGKG